MDPYQKLANAVILQAIADYRIARRGLKKATERLKVMDGQADNEVWYRLFLRKKAYQKTIRDLEEFFLSERFSRMTTICGADTLEHLRNEVIR